MPILVDGYLSARQSNNVFNQVIGGVTDVTLRPMSARVGTLRLLYATEEDALDAEYTLMQQEALKFANSELPSADMTFVVDGQITRQLDPESRYLWIITVDFREVAA